MSDPGYTCAKDFFVVWELLWGPSGRGYTKHLLGAGLYTQLELDGMSLERGIDIPRKLDDVVAELYIPVHGRTVLTHLGTSRRLAQSSEDG